MNELQKKYGELINDFNQKINRIPPAIEKVNDKIDFSSGRYQEIMIDIEGSCTTLAEDFYLLAEEIDKLFNVNQEKYYVVIDFLHYENYITKLTAKNKEQAILKAVAESPHPHNIMYSNTKSKAITMVERNQQIRDWHKEEAEHDNI